MADSLPSELIASRPITSEKQGDLSCPYEVLCTFSVFILPHNHLYTNSMSKERLGYIPLAVGSVVGLDKSYRPLDIISSRPSI